MTRIKRGYISQRHRRNIRASNFIKTHSRLTRTIIQQRIKALVSTHRDNYKKKINSRYLWITRINSIIRKVGVSYSYCKFIHNMYKEHILLNRKILSQISISNKLCFYIILNEIYK